MNQSMKDNIARNEAEQRLRQHDRDRREVTVQTNLSLLSLTDLNRMESDEYRNYLRTVPAFAEKADELWKTEQRKPAKA